MLVKSLARTTSCTTSEIFIFVAGLVAGFFIVCIVWDCYCCFIGVCKTYIVRFCVDTTFLVLTMNSIALVKILVVYCIIGI